MDINLSSQQLAKPLLPTKHKSSHKNKDGKNTNPLGIWTEMNAAYSQHIHFSLGHFFLYFIGQYSEWATGNWKGRQHALKALSMNHMNKETFFSPFFLCDAIYISCWSMLIVMHRCCAQLMGQREKVLPVLLIRLSLSLKLVSVSEMDGIPTSMLRTWYLRDRNTGGALQMPSTMCMCMSIIRRAVCTLGWVLVLVHRGIEACRFVGSMQSVENSPFTR